MRVGCAPKPLRPGHGLALQHPHNDSLRYCAASNAAVHGPLGLLRLVHILELAADNGFVHLHGSAAGAELENRLIPHRKANPLEHEPGALLGHANIPRDLVTGDAVLAVSQEPHGREPFL